MALPEVPLDGKFRILVLEDEPDVARLILATLETVGFECHHRPRWHLRADGFRRA